jgi:hypothetical protein
MELLRARAAADRLELSIVSQDVSSRLAPLRAAGRVVGMVARFLGARSRVAGAAARAKGVIPTRCMVLATAIGALVFSAISARRARRASSAAIQDSGSGRRSRRGGVKAVAAD